MFALDNLRYRTEWIFVDSGNLASNFPCLLEPRTLISRENVHYELSWGEGNSQSLPLVMEPVNQIILLFTP